MVVVVVATREMMFIRGERFRGVSRHWFVGIQTRLTLTPKRVDAFCKDTRLADVHPFFGFVDDQTKSNFFVDVD